MVFNKDVLFIHLGKTGGMSVTDYLCNTLEPPVYHVLPQSHLESSKPLGYEQMIPGNRHASLTVAKEIIEPFNMKISDFKLIFVIVRNPFELHFSYYKHLRKPHIIKRLSQYPNSKKRLDAAMGDYEDFAQEDFVHYNGNLAAFFQLNGRRPDNMKVVNFENLNIEIPLLIKPFAINDYPFPHRNKSPEYHLTAPLSDKALLCIRNKYAYILKNFYPDLM